MTNQDYKLVAAGVNMALTEAQTQEELDGMLTTMSALAMTFGEKDDWFDYAAFEKECRKGWSVPSWYVVRRDR